MTPGAGQRGAEDGSGAAAALPKPSRLRPPRLTPSREAVLRRTAGRHRALEAEGRRPPATLPARNSMRLSGRAEGTGRCSHASTPRAPAALELPTHRVASLEVSVQRGVPAGLLGGCGHGVCGWRAAGTDGQSGASQPAVCSPAISVPCSNYSYYREYSAEGGSVFVPSIKCSFSHY